MELSIVSPEPVIPELPGIGQTVDLFGYTWLVCHDDGSKKYLITDDIIREVHWDSENTTSGGYIASDIKKECDQFAIDTGIDQLDYVVDTGVGKVFIPTKEQMTGESGGFSYFDSDSKRIAKLNESTACYWTSSSYQYGQYSCVWIVDSDGGIYDISYASGSSGFRPCICIDTTLYDS